jgi:LL-diaminopimelate aminotransferase
MVKEQCALYQERRDALCGGLRSIGWDCPDSHGTLFVWAPIPASYTSSMNFCLDLMEKAGVICTPGSSFGPLGEGYVRFALVLPPARIKEAVQAIAHSGILSSH